MNSILAHTSSRADDNALRIARVAAASRLAAERVAAEARAAVARAHNLAIAEALVADWTAAGATEVGFKIWSDDGGKWRPVYLIAHAADFMAGLTEPFDAWPLAADGSQVGEGFGAW